MGRDSSGPGWVINYQNLIGSPYTEQQFSWPVSGSVKHSLVEEGTGDQGRADHRETSGTWQPLAWHRASQSTVGSTISESFGQTEITYRSPLKKVLCSYRLKNMIGFKYIGRLERVKGNKGLVLTRMAVVCKEPESGQVLFGRTFVLAFYGALPTFFSNSG